MRIFLFLMMHFLASTFYCHGQNYSPHNLLLETTLFDGPYQYQVGQFFPSMEQSLQITKSFYQASSYGTGHLAHFIVSDTASDKRVFRDLLKGVFDVGFHVGTLTVPGGHAWLHEEYHAHIGRNCGVHGKNLVNRFPSITSGFITVYDVNDEDLIQMKAKSNADFVRMSAAGLEGQTDLVTRLQSDHFFYNTTKALAQSWIIVWHNNRYIGSAAQNNIGLEQNEIENRNVASRDLVGWDPLAWVYDLFRPNEPYENRGVHPTGIGIDRYIVTDDLTTDEIDFLEKQSRLASLSYLDPFMFGFRRFRVGKEENPFYFNLNLKHFLTSFGHSIQTNVFLEHGDIRGSFKVLQYANYNRQFIGFDARLMDLQTRVFNKGILISPRLSAWTQPKDQVFKTESGQFGGLIGAKAFFPISKKMWATLELESKTQGWVVSNPYLDANSSGRIGIQWRMISE